MMLGLALLVTAGMAQAQTAGSNVINFGWLNIAPHNDSTPLTIINYGGAPVNMVQTGSGFKALEANTIGLTFSHYFTDHISGQFFAGIPTDLKFAGTGTLSSAGTIGKAMPLSPTIFANYHFFDARAKFRPYVGLGLNYTKFVKGKVTNQQFVESSLGPGATAKVRASGSWNPAYAVGADYAINNHWGLGLSISYIPVSTTATLTETAANGFTVVSRATDKLDPVNMFLYASYRL